MVAVTYTMSWVIVGWENVREACARARLTMGVFKGGSWMAGLKNNWCGIFAREA